MKDRVPGAPGQYTASVTAGEFAKLENGKSFSITLMRDDHPLVEGTPYSKAAVLPDEVAAALCPGVEDPTPADAFKALAGRTKAVESAEHPGCYYLTIDGETEWINPPMIPGVEYRTTERYNGKPVYTKFIDYGKGSTALSFYIDTQITKPFRYVSVLVKMATTMAFGDSCDFVRNDQMSVLEGTINFSGYTSPIYINTGKDTSNENFYVTIKYYYE